MSTVELDRELRSLQPDSLTLQYKRQHCVYNANVSKTSFTVTPHSTAPFVSLREKAFHIVHDQLQVEFHFPMLISHLKVHLWVLWHNCDIEVDAKQHPDSISLVLTTDSPTAISACPFPEFTTKIVAPTPVIGSWPSVTVHVTILDEHPWISDGTKMVARTVPALNVLHVYLSGSVKVGSLSANMFKPSSK
jgi:hypothetical protein